MAARGANKDCWLSNITRFTLNTVKYLINFNCFRESASGKKIVIFWFLSLKYGVLPRPFPPALASFYEFKLTANTWLLAGSMCSSSVLMT